MPYVAFAPNRIVTGTELYATVNGNADGLPAAEAYCTYLLDAAILDFTEAAVENCIFEISYQRGTHFGYPGIGGKPWVPYTPLFVHLDLPAADLDPGDYTFRFTLATTVNTAASFDEAYTQTIDLPVFVSQRPLPVWYSNPEIPGVAPWEEHMIQLADKWEPIILDRGNTQGETNWYYDVASTYWQVGDYIHRSNRYAYVALESARRYEEYLLAAQSQGGPAAYKLFPRGLRQTYERTQDTRWLDALKLTQTGAYVSSAGDTDPALMRETAYATDVWRELEYVNEGDGNLLNHGVAFLLGQFNLLCVQKFGRDSGMVCEPFFFGLAMQTLIDCYDMDPDDRIPQAIAATCEWLWQNAVDAQTGRVEYDAWHNEETTYTSLNGLMLNAWGFLYKLTGDSVYRRQGDVLFAHIFDDDEWSWTPKQFAQIYRRTIDYVTRWRA